MQSLMILATTGHVRIYEILRVNIVRFSVNEIGRISVFNRNIKDYSKSKYMLVEKEL